MTDADAEKRLAAEAAAELVEDGMTVGLGTGSTVAHLLPAIAARGLTGIRCVATSVATEEQARGLGIPVEDFDSCERLEIAIDGTDQVTPDGWLIKGGGGAHLREKVVAAAADRFIVISDSSKPVEELTWRVPVELFAFGLASTLARLGDAVELRGHPRSPDDGVIADYRGDVTDPAPLAAMLEADPGVAAHGSSPRRWSARCWSAGRDGRAAELDQSRKEERDDGFQRAEDRRSPRHPRRRRLGPGAPGVEPGRRSQAGAVAFAQSAGDVARTVAFAAANGLRVTGQGTGHGGAALPDLEDTILIKTEGMREIEIDADAGTARVGAGVLSVELGEAAGKHGMCSMPGSSPDVGVIGYTLGGGLSWFARKHGFACNRVRAIELVTADGEQRTVDAENEPDLFWALRGGGGGYAIVTSLQVELLPIAEVYAGALVFPAAVGADAVRTYRDWAAEQPDEVTSVVRFVTPPPIPDVPEPIGGVPLLTIDGAVIGSREDGEAAFAPLREIGETIMDTLEWMPTAGLSHIHMDPENPVPGVGEGGLVGELSDAALDAFVGLAGPDSGSPMLLSELRHAGGALRRPDPDGGALAHLDAGYVMYSVGMPMTPELGAAIRGHIEKIGETMKPHAAEGGYFNFTESSATSIRSSPPTSATDCAR